MEVETISRKLYARSLSARPERSRMEAETNVGVARGLGGKEYFHPMKIFVKLLLVLPLFLGCSPSKMQMQTFPATHPSLHWQGRIIEDSDSHKWLFGSAAYLRFRFKGDSCKVLLRNHAPGTGAEYNYISFVIDGVHTQRIKINFDTLDAITILPEHPAPAHDVEVYKETEAKNGAVEIDGIEAMDLDTFSYHPAHHIEFIGNSITAGMSSDVSQVPCDKGKWYDQHNAYDSYGPVVSRKLNCDFMVVAFSGLGMYRNWATDAPVMHDVYESTMLDPDPTSPRYDYNSFNPDVIVMCVGANDLSDGDGVTPRSPFDSTKFISTYISFISNLHQHHPQAQFLLLNGPVNPSEKDVMFKACLSSIKVQAAKEITNLKPITLYFFPLIQPKGCGGHPDVAQHAEMAEQIEPVLKSMLQ
jgi:hypothetical protein